MARVREGHGIAGQNCCVIGGCLLSFSLCRRGFQDLLKVRPSSLLILCWCISNSVASLMSQSMYPVFAERSFVFYSLMSVFNNVWGKTPAALINSQLINVNSGKFNTEYRLFWMMNRWFSNDQDNWAKSEPAWPTRIMWICGRWMPWWLQ